MDKIGGPHSQPEMVETYFRSISHVGRIVKNNLYFKLITLITLLDVDPMMESGAINRDIMELVRLRMAFLKLMKRRMRVDQFQNGSMNMDFDEFEAALAQVKKISHFIGRLMRGGPPNNPPPPPEKQAPEPGDELYIALDQRT